MIKNLPVIQETQVRFLGWKDPLEKGMATHSGILAWRIPWTEEPGGLQSMGLQESDTTEQLNTCKHTLPNSTLVLMAFSTSVPDKAVPAGGERSSLRRVGTFDAFCSVAEPFSPTHTSQVPFSFSSFIPQLRNSVSLGCPALT